MSDTSKLRWALHENVYQPGLLFPAEELLEMELPPGHTVVYLLGLDSNVVLPDSDVSEYNPRDAEKMSNPAAAVGVAMAQQILDGFQGTEDGADDTANGNGHLLDNEDGDDNVVTASELRLLDEDDRGSVEDEEARRARRHEEKKQRKEEKKAAKEAKKAAKAAVKREREDVTSAPTLRRKAISDEDDEDDEDDELLAATAIEKKYGSPSVKKEKAGEEEEEAGESSRHRKHKKPAEEGTWAALEEDLFSNDEDDDEDEEEEGRRQQRAAGARGAAASTQQRSQKSGNRMGQALAALNAKTALHDIPGLSGSYPYAQPYLMEIHYEYELLAEEAVKEHLLLSLHKGEVIRAIDDELRQKAAQKAFLEAALNARQRQASGDAASNEIDALYDAMTKLDAPLSVVDAVRRLVSKQPPSHAAAFDRAAATRARRAVQRRTRTFQDATVVTLVDHLRNVDAAPREDGADVMRRYIQQRRQHEELKTNFRGLSKTGFHAVQKPMERWRRARDMMVLANVGAEAQKVLPTSYISQAHSTMLRRMKEHAERRYDRVAVTARDGASFLDASSFTGGHGATSSSLPFATPSSAMGNNASSLASQQALQQQRLAASNASTRREAFFQFHALRCDTEAPVTLETVALNAGLAGAGMSQNVLASVGDVTASVAPLGGHLEDSTHTDDGASQRSYSAHSAAPSSYAYIFDSEPHPRRTHRYRGSNVSAGYSSEGEGISRTSSRATSVGSVHGDSANGGETAATTDKRRRQRDASGKANGAATTTTTTAATSTTDWRANAKRSLMEQLTLYCRGRGGKPAILSADQCREIGRTLLERAMRAEAERQGVSLAVQTNNLAAPFTKTTEQRLKKSVDHYLERRMAQSNTPALDSGSTAAGIMANGNGAPWAAGGNGGGAQGGGVLPMPGDAVLPFDAVAVARQRAVADTPVYEN